MACPLPHTLARYSAGLDLGRPLVGVHVRRTDKIGFGVLQPQVLPVGRYLGRAEAWWRWAQPSRHPRVHLLASPGPRLVRRLYVASDDPRSLGEVRRTYPNITALGDWQIAKSAALKTR